MKARREANFVLAGLDRLVEKYHLLKHPFYRAWADGTLSRETLALYAEQYYQHVRAFPENLEKLAGRADAELRTIVNDNLAEELDPAGPHPKLWREFAGAVGAREAELNAGRALPGVAALLDAFDELCENGSKAQAVAAFYVYESQVPEIATQKIAGLKKHSTLRLSMLCVISRCTRKPMCGIAPPGARGLRRSPNRNVRRFLPRANAL